MTRIYMVRHGRAAAGWNVDPDPGLDELGRTQALNVATTLSPRGPLPVWSSPLLRCQQTAFPLSTAWKTEAVIEPRVGEIPSPENYSLENRVEWLREAMAGTWGEVAERSGAHYATYRDDMVSAIRGISADTVIFSHYIAINVVLGAATHNDNVVVANLDNCSVTTFDVDTAGTLTLVEIGGEADTLIR
jgi:broad specificity phosphatase PhoE